MKSRVVLLLLFVLAFMLPQSARALSFSEMVQDIVHMLVCTIQGLFGYPCVDAKSTSLTYEKKNEEGFRGRIQLAAAASFEPPSVATSTGVQNQPVTEKPTPPFVTLVTKDTPHFNEGEYGTLTVRLSISQVSL